MIGILALLTAGGLFLVCWVVVLSLRLKRAQARLVDAANYIKWWRGELSRATIGPEAEEE